MTQYFMIMRSDSNASRVWPNA